MNDEVTTPEAQVVGEVSIGDIAVEIAGQPIFTEPVQIAKTPEADAKTAKLVQRLRVAQNRLLRRQTGNLSRLGSLLSRVNALRTQLKLNTVTLKQIRGLSGPNDQK